MFRQEAVSDWCVQRSHTDMSRACVKVFKTMATLNCYQRICSRGVLNPNDSYKVAYLL